MLRVDTIITFKERVTDVLDAGSRWRVSTRIDGGGATIQRIGKTGRRITSKHTVNEYRLTTEEYKWLRSGGYINEKVIAEERRE